LSVELRVV
jgi:hypothetical protein